VFENGEFIGSSTYSILDLLDLLKSKRGITHVILEDSRIQSHLFTAPNASDAVRIKVARNVGMVDLVCKLIVEVLDNSSIKLACVSPRAKGSKIKTNEALYVLTGVKLQSNNQHERDAVLLAYPYRNVRL
jgi:hypothetical protein